MNIIYLTPPLKLPDEIDECGFTHEGFFRWIKFYRIELDQFQLRLDTIVDGNQIHFDVLLPVVTAKTGNNFSKKCLRSMRKFLHKDTAIFRRTLSANERVVAKVL